MKKIIGTCLIGMTLTGSVMSMTAGECREALDKAVQVSFESGQKSGAALMAEEITKGLLREGILSKSDVEEYSKHADQALKQVEAEKNILNATLGLIETCFLLEK